MWSAIGGVVSFIAKEVSAWAERRDKLQAAELDVQLAEAKSRAELAAYKLKSDIEWDLKWADASSRSWRPEFILVLWSLPTICLFVPGLRGYVMDGFEFLKLFDPNAPAVFMAGWGIIFAATFGMKQALSFMLPGKAAKLAEAFSKVPDDIPASAVEKVTERLRS
ncbi:MAG: hypothetical protein AB1698_01665 [Pseudomonadota bacterium]